MNIKESIQQINELIEAWELNEACLNQTDIDAMKCLLKENQELKLELSGYRQAILNNKEMLGLKEQNQALKKQVENYKKLGFKHLVDKNNNLEAQQKEFIKNLEDEIYSIEPKGTGINYNCEYDSEEDYVMAMQEQSRLNTLKEILQKYKEITEEIDNENND